MSVNDIYVGIGEVKIGSCHDVLHTMLGSCVGIALLHPANQCYGLAHCLLPFAHPAQQPILGAKYVDQAVVSLLELMQLEEADYPSVTAVIAGGGNMTKSKHVPREQLIGAGNVAAANKCLKALGIRIIDKDVEGLQGRTLTLCCQSGAYHIKRLARSSLS